MSSFHPNVFAESIVNALPQSRLSPLVEVVEDGLVIGEVVGQQFPRSTRTQLIEDGVEDLSAIHGRSSSFFGAGLGLGDQGFQTLPLLVGQVGRVWLACHAQHR